MERILDQRQSKGKTRAQFLYHRFKIIIAIKSLVRFIKKVSISAKVETTKIKQLLINLCVQRVDKKCNTIIKVLLGKE